MILVCRTKGLRNFSFIKEENLLRKIGIQKELITSKMQLVKNGMLREFHSS